MKAERGLLQEIIETLKEVYHQIPGTVQREQLVRDQEVLHLQSDQAQVVPVVVQDHR